MTQARFTASRRPDGDRTAFRQCSSSDSTLHQVGVDVSRGACEPMLTASLKPAITRPIATTTYISRPYHVVFGKGCRKSHTPPNNTGPLRTRNHRQLRTIFPRSFTMIAAYLLRAASTYLIPISP